VRKHVHRKSDLRSVAKRVFEKHHQVRGGVMLPQLLEHRCCEPGVLVPLLEAAGFVDVHEHTEITDLWYASPEAWWASLWTHGSRRPLERMPADVLADFQSAAMERVRAMAERRGVLEQMQLVYIAGRVG
jgi:hypothetical protein